MKGAQIIFVVRPRWPNITHEDDSPTQLAYELYPTARAWENQVFFVVSDYAMIYAAGHSRIVGPGPLKGVLATTGYEEGMAVAEADIVEDIMKSRSDWTDGNDNLRTASLASTIPLLSPIRIHLHMADAPLRINR